MVMVMQDAFARAGAEKPAIQISETDYELIAQHAMRMEARFPEQAEMLFSEIDRAEVRQPEEIPSDVVTLGSLVSYSDDSSGTVRQVRLVVPGEADIEKGQISIVTPVGVGLIGLRTGQSIDWPCPDGRARTLTILDVSRPA